MYQLDYIHDKALDAIQAANPKLASWCDGIREHRKQYEPDKLAGLQFIAFNLDSGNQEIVADAFGFDVEDIHALKRILQKT